MISNDLEFHHTTEKKEDNIDNQINNKEKFNIKNIGILNDQFQCFLIRNNNRWRVLIV